MGPIVRLTDDERVGIGILARMRNEPKVAAGVTDYRVPVNVTSLALHERGLEGEVAVAKVFGGVVRMRLGIAGLRDKQGDVLLHDGRAVNVKTTLSGSARYWQVPMRQDMPEPIGVLCLPGFPGEVFVERWLTRAAYRKHREERMLGGKTAWCVPWEKMQDVGALYGSRIGWEEVPAEIDFVGLEIVTLDATGLRRLGELAVRVLPQPQHE